MKIFDILVAVVVKIIIFVISIFFPWAAATVRKASFLFSVGSLRKYDGNDLILSLIHI